MKSMIPLLLITALFFGAYNFFMKASSGHIHEVAGAVVLQVVATLLGIVTLTYLRYQHINIEYSAVGIGLAIAAGACVGLAEILSFYVFSKGVPVSTGLAVIVGGSVLTGTALGLIFLKETIAPAQIFAILLIITGIILLVKN